MATLDGENIIVGDDVFDLIYGAGEVTEITLDGRIKVQFGPVARESYYSQLGVSTRWPRRTLYWRDPVLAPPLKSDADWAKAQAACVAIVGVFRS